MVETSPSNARGTSSIPGQGAKIPYALWPKKPIKQEQYGNKFNNDFKNGPHKKKIFKKTCIKFPSTQILFVRI